MKTTNILSILSILVIAAPSALAATPSHEHVTNYGDGLTMHQYDDSFDFTVSVQGGPTFKFDSQTQKVRMTSKNGTFKIIDLAK